MNPLRSGFWRRAECGVFASRSVVAHLLRGVIAATLLASFFANYAAHPVFAVIAGAVAVFVMRGCPMCWTIGLFETIAGRMKRG